MGRKRERQWKIELDGDVIEDAIERGARKLEEQLDGLKGLRVSVQHDFDDDDDDDDRTEDKNTRGRRRQVPEPVRLSKRERREAERTIVVPPESKDEFNQRLVNALISPVGFWTLGGMCIPGFINLFGGDPAVGGAFIAAGVVFYFASAAAQFQSQGDKREKLIRRQILAGERPAFVPSAASATTPPGSAASVAAPYSPRAQMEALVERIRGRLDLEHPAVSISELARFSELAAHYETKATEIRAYLAEVGGLALAQSDLARLRTQLEQMRPDDPRADSTARLIAIKEQTVRNLQSLERYLATVEGKFQEQIAHLESLDAALMRHKLGTFARQTHAEETLSTREVESLASGLTQSADALEHDLARINLELA